MKPFVYTCLFALLVLASCRKNHCKCGQPHPQEDEHFCKFPKDSVIIDKGGLSDCILIVPKNENTDQKNLSFSTYFQTPKEKVTAPPTEVKWFTKINSNAQFCDSVAFVLNSATNATQVFPDVSAFVPNTFTPNGDGTNDSLIVLVQGAYVNYKFQVFDRWGEVVFESNTPNQSWDGKQNSTDQPAGTYFTKLEAEFFAKNDSLLYVAAKTGFVNLLR